MWCLWNGEYGEHDLDMYNTNSCSEKHIQRMEQEYAKYPGMVVGDFTCLKVEYDWGRRDQRWTIKCNRCGRELFQYHAADWRRGKGRSLHCQCRKEEEKAEREAKKEAFEEERKKRRSEIILEKQKEYLGKEYNGWSVVEYKGLSTCKIKCTKCGKERNSVSINDVANEIIAPCNHKIPNDYSGDEWIGKRNGYLTTIGRDGSLFIVRCDCGRQTKARGTDLFTRKTKRSCGLRGCVCSTDEHIASIERREKGFGFEKDIEKYLTDLGFNAKKTVSVGDFGVDIIITEKDGSLTAVQCKNQDDPAGVNAVQEVYAGGRFYDCVHFSVICKSGFSNSAITMARKLGVYLCDSEYNPPEDIEKYADSLLPVFNKQNTKEKLYEINGHKRKLADWCYIYGNSETTVRNNLKKGMSLEMALVKRGKSKETFTIRDITGSINEICDHFGVLPQTISYRMKHMNMTLEEAIFYKIK